MSDVRPDESGCVFRLVRTKRKGQICGRVATKVGPDDKAYCLVHWRVVNTASDKKKPDDETQISGVSQLEYSETPMAQEIPSEWEEEVQEQGTRQQEKKRAREKAKGSYQRWKEELNDKKAKRMRFKDEAKLDFDALERACLESMKSKAFNK